MALLPEVPTVAESGLPGYEAVSWFGLFGPPGMPLDIVAKINAEVCKTFADPEVKKNFLERQYFESIAGTPEQLAKYIKADEPKWRKVIHEAKVKGSELLLLSNGRSMMPPGSGRPILRDARAYVSCVKHHGLLALLRMRAAQIPSSLRALPPAMAAMVAASKPSAEATWPIGS